MKKAKTTVQASLPAGLTIVNDTIFVDNERFECAQVWEQPISSVSRDAYMNSRLIGYKFTPKPASTTLQSSGSICVLTIGNTWAAR